MSLIICNVGQRLWRPEPRVQLRTSYAAWVEWVAPERKMPTEEYVASAGDYSLPGYSIVPSVLPSVFAW